LKKLLALIAILVALPLAAQRRRAVDPQPVQRLLFIGNSLTASNDLPSMVCRLAAATRRPAVCSSVAIGGFSLQDHFNDGQALRPLRNEKWSIVVLQQGPSALESSRVNLRQWTATFAELIRAAGGRPALYAVWPERARIDDFDRVSESYRLAASDVDGLFFPVGDAWLAAWRRDSRLALYGSDDFHPTPAGTYLAALVIYRVIWGELPPLLTNPNFASTFAGVDLGLTDSRLDILARAAEEAVTTDRAR